MTPPSIGERRKLKRRKLAYYMLVRDGYSQKTIGHLVDISPTGLMLDCQSRMPVEKEFHLRLDTTSDVANKNFITFTARSKWCRPDSFDPSLFDVGFSIIGISAEDAAVIRRIAEKYAAQDWTSY
jgi:hypothetical protein